METNDSQIKFETLYGWKTSIRYEVPVEYPLFLMDECYLRSLMQKERKTPIQEKGRAIQEYDNPITSDDILKFDKQLQDLALEGIMVGQADHEAKKLAEQYGIEIREHAKLRIRQL